MDRNGLGTLIVDLLVWTLRPTHKGSGAPDGRVVRFPSHNLHSVFGPSRFPGKGDRITRNARAALSNLAARGCSSGLRRGRQRLPGNSFRTAHLPQGSTSLIIHLGCFCSRALCSISTPNWCDFIKGCVEATRRDCAYVHCKV